MESEKFGMPLYGVAWPPGEHIYVGGGGGHGLVNRVVVTRYNEEGLHEQVGEHLCGAHAVLKMSADPSGQVLLCAFPKGVKAIRVETEEGKAPKLSDGELGPALEALSDMEVSCMGWNADGSLLVVGGESGEVKAIDWKKQEVVYERKMETKVSDADVVEDELLLTLDSGKVVVILPSTETVSEVPAAAALGTTRRARWARDGTGRVFVAAISGGEGRAGILERAPDGVFTVQRKVLASKNPITAMDVSAEGDLVGINDCEGNISVFTENLRLIKRWPNAHMVFGTALTFAGDGHALASVSADASTTVVPCDRPNEAARMLRTLLLVALLLAIAYMFAAKVFAESYTGTSHDGEL